VVVITEKNRNNFLPSVSRVLLRGLQRGTCVARWVCRQVRMWLDTSVFVWQIVIFKTERSNTCTDTSLVNCRAERLI